MKISPRNILFIGISLFIGLGVKLLFSTCDTDSLTIVLGPTTFFTSLFSGVSFQYVIGEGYLSQTKDILIDKSCSGVNFFVISFLMSSFFIVNTFSTIKQKSIGLFAVLLSSYIVTIIANVFRVTGAILIVGNSDKVSFLSAPWVHEAEGAVVYLFCLISYYLLLNKTINNQQLQYAKHP